MARSGEIRDKAAESLERYLSDANFRFLLYNRDRLSKKEADGTCISYVLGYVSGLAEALKRNDLITMRRHAFRPESYQESFAGCAQKVKKILSEKEMEEPVKREQTGQMSLLEFGVDMGQCR